MATTALSVDQEGIVLEGTEVISRRSNPGIVDRKGLYIASIQLCRWVHEPGNLIDPGMSKICDPATAGLGSQTGNLGVSKK
jgi:hypothetical protein